MASYYELRIGHPPGQRWPPVVELRTEDGPVVIGGKPRRVRLVIEADGGDLTLEWAVPQVKPGPNTLTVGQPPEEEP